MGTPIEINYGNHTIRVLTGGGAAQERNLAGLIRTAIQQIENGDSPRLALPKQFRVQILTGPYDQHIVINSKSELRKSLEAVVNAENKANRANLR